MSSAYRTSIGQVLTWRLLPGKHSDPSRLLITAIANAKL